MEGVGVLRDTGVGTDFGTLLLWELREEEDYVEVTPSDRHPIFYLSTPLTC